MNKPEIIRKNKIDLKFQIYILFTYILCINLKRLKIFESFLIIFYNWKFNSFHNQKYLI